MVFDDQSGWTKAARLEETSRAIATRFRAAGLAPGDRVIISAGATSDLVIAYAGCLRAGLVVVPVNGAYTEREVAHIVGDARPRAAIIDNPLWGGWIGGASERPPMILGTDVDLPDGHDEDLPTLGPDAPALICYTSGTTGTPKGAVLTHGNLLSNCEALRLAWRWTPEDRLILALPLFHMHGLGVGIHGSLATGASVVLRPGFDSGDVLDAAGVHQASLFFGVPTMYARLVVAAGVEALGALRLCVSGSAPLAPDLHRAIESQTGQVVLERYGMTETVMNVSNPYEGERRPGTVGFPLPGVEVDLGDQSQILLRGPNVTQGYWDRPEATSDSFDAEGWFRTGDVGEFDRDGYLKIVGRLKELIITGGYNVYPREVEDALRGYPGVADLAVVGQPSDEWGQAVTAFVVADGEVDVSGLIAYAHTQLAPYKCPKAVRIVDELPRNALGKVMRAELEALA
ncbi:MAG: AMP-binding protein [Actinobacteria bacterium]|nr:AMP-binding protein [Actinomycetota bacterium]